MRPGPIGPGIINYYANEWYEVLASMRPGPIGPGILITSLTLPDFLSLQ